MAGRAKLTGTFGPAFLVSVCLAFPAEAQLGSTPPEGTRPAQWRVIWQEDPAHQAIIAFSTEDDGTSTVYFDTEPRSGVTAAYTSQVSCTTGRYTFSLSRYHHCLLTDLEPSTTYYFVTQTEGDVSRELHFVTAPDDGRPFKLLFGGDSRSDQGQRREMNELIRRMVEQDPEILALAHGGDYIENGLSFGQWSDWMTDHELTITSAGRVLPVIPTRGNHESVGSLFGQVWADPPNDQYFSTVINDFWLITLNTETSQAGDQRDFLERQLEAAVQANACFISAQYHRPAYPAVKSPGDALINWVPLFEQYDADLIFESDGHALKRTVPIRNEQEDPTGVVYVGEGGLGVEQRTPESDRWYLDFAASQHHVQVLTVERTRLSYAAVAPDLTVVDAATFDSRRCLPASLELKTPEPGAELISGANYAVTWTTDGPIAEIDLDYSTDDGVTWQPIAVASPNMGRFDWLVPSEPSDAARVRIRAPGGIEVVSGAFSIALPPMDDPPDAGTAPQKPEDPAGGPAAETPDDPQDGQDVPMSANNAEMSPPPAAGGCGCTAAEGSGGGLLFAGLLGLALRRSKR